MAKRPHARTFTTHFPRLDVTWRVTTSKVAGWGAFGDSVRFSAVIVDVQEKLKAA